ncbi:hypothetical protein Lser_V15G11742 [Lactuca serriola]
MWIWHVIFGSPGLINDINILNRSQIFNNIYDGSAPNSSFQVRGTPYKYGYYLVDGIYPEYDVFVKSFTTPHGRMQVYKIVSEGLKDEAPVELANLDNKPPDTLMMEEMQVQMEKMEEDLHIIRVDDEDSTLYAKDLDPCKDESAEGSEKSSPTKTDVKIFI